MTLDYNDLRDPAKLTAALLERFASAGTFGQRLDVQPSVVVTKGRIAQLRNASLLSGWPGPTSSSRTLSVTAASTTETLIFSEPGVGQMSFYSTILVSWALPTSIQNAMSRITFSQVRTDGGIPIPFDCTFDMQLLTQAGEMMLTPYYTSGEWGMPAARLVLKNVDGISIPITITFDGAVGTSFTVTLLGYDAPHLYVMRSISRIRALLNDIEPAYTEFETFLPNMGRIK